MIATRSWSLNTSPIAAPPITTWSMGHRARHRSASAPGPYRRCTANAVSGVFSEDFQTTEFPQTGASAAVSRGQQRGKLNALMTAQTPIGCHVSRITLAAAPMR